MKFGAVFLSLVLMVLSSGCTTPWQEHPTEYTSNIYVKESQEEAAEMAVDLKFDDIPVPAGFQMQVNESFAFKNGYTRVGVIRYTGRGDITSVTTFFKNQMPMYNWEVVNSIEYRRSVLNFLKEGQSATVIIEQASGNRLILTVASGPVNQ